MSPIWSFALGAGLVATVGLVLFAVWLHGRRSGRTDLVASLEQARAHLMARQPAVSAVASFHSPDKAALPSVVVGARPAASMDATYAAALDALSAQGRAPAVNSGFTLKLEEGCP